MTAFLLSILLNSIIIGFRTGSVSSIGEADTLVWKLGPVKELIWDQGPVSLGLVMDMSLVSASGKNSQDLLISRIWKGMYNYPSESFSDKSLSQKPLFMGKASILLFQPSDWNNDGIPDLIAADRDGFLFLIPGNGKYPDTQYEKSEHFIIRDASNNLPFNLPYENPNLQHQDDLGGYIDTQYYNYTYPEIYSTSEGKFRDLIIGDGAGNLWWLPDHSKDDAKPVFSGVKYTKEPSRHPAGMQYQKNLGLDYVKPGSKICDEDGKPFLLGIGNEAGFVYTGANTRPVLYHDESGIPGLLVIAGSNKQQIFYLKRVNSIHERKPVFRNLGEINISGLDNSRLNFHSKICLFKNNERNDLLLATGNYLAVLNYIEWNNGKPEFKFTDLIKGTNVPASGYRFDDIITDDNGKNYIIDFASNCWRLIPVEKMKDGIRLHYTEFLQIMDQNGIFRVEGETDPQFSPEWGYHRIARWDFEGNGKNHLIVGTDKGHLYLLKEEPSLTVQGKFNFISFGPLKDTSGCVIRIHSRAVAGSIDLNRDGCEDLVVGGISYQLGIKSDPDPGGGIYYLLNLGNDSSGCPILTPPMQIDLGPDFKPRINSHIGLQIMDIDHDNEKEIIISLQEPGWGGRIYHKTKDKPGLFYSGSRIPLEPIIEQIIDIDGDSQYDIVRPGDESGVGFYRKLEKIGP
jgi:hypothetical protein